ncbi:MAG TPA: PAS domain S-box protein [Gemmatimonadaceae bacterium]
MDRVGSNEAVTAATASDEGRNRGSSLRAVLAAMLPPLAAFIAQELLWITSARWSLFYPAVFLSSWIGGYASGISATLISSVLLWWLLIPPLHTFVKTDPRQYVAEAIFILMGIMVSTLHRRLRHTNHGVRDALLAANKATNQLQEVIDERHVFTSLIENSSDFIGVADTSGTPVYINPAGRRMVGIAQDFPVSTMPISEYYPPELHDFVTSVIIRETLAKGRWQGEASLRHWQTNQAIPVSVTAFLINDTLTKRVLGIGTITRDISEMKRARDELARSQRFLQAILDHSPNAIVIKDLTGRYIIANRRVEELLGIPVNEVQGKRDVDLFGEAVAEHFRADDRIVAETATPLSTEEALQLRDGLHVFLVSKFPLVTERLFAICAIWVDITDRKRDEEAMTQTATDLREAQRLAHIGSWSWDLADKVQWSDELYRIFGRDPSSPVAMPFRYGSSVFTPESSEQLRTAIGKLVDGGDPFEIELEFPRPDGSTGWVAARGEGVRDSTGRLTGIRGTVQDISRIKELQRMRDEWTSIIAHDLRQPIGFIAMAADFLPTLHDDKLADKERDFTQRIQSAAKTLARMVNDLLDISLLEADQLKLERKSVDPRILVSDTLKRVAHLIGERRIKVVEEQALVNVFVDPMRVGQVLGNLLSNAIKYGDKNREIIVEEKRRDGECEIAVTNYGHGIESADLTRIFNRFARSKTSRGSGVLGLGLGLYIAKGVIRAHGGRIWAESTPGQTTTFHVTLPTTAMSRQAA